MPKIKITMVAIIDYDTGNLRSVINAFNRLGAEIIVTADHQQILQATHVVLPGVGEASSAMEKLRARGLDTLIPTLTQPTLGICIGLQLMCKSSAEGDAQCMGIFPTEVRFMSPAAEVGLKIPHVGWDNVNWTLPEPPIAKDIPEGAHFYYVHSFAAALCPDTIATTDYGAPFSAALQHRNFFGVQFHPEKSGPIGETLLRNFLTIKF